MKSKNHRRIAALAATGLLLAACGDEADESVATQFEPSVTAAPTNDATVASDPPMPDGEAASADQPVATDGATQPAATDAPADTEVAADATPDAPAESDGADPEVVEPDVVQPAVLGGRALTEALTAESGIETNMLPDLIVDDVGRQSKVNLRNVFPAERPVLFWMWAPH